MNPVTPVGRHLNAGSHKEDLLFSFFAFLFSRGIKSSAVRIYHCFILDPILSRTCMLCDKLHPGFVVLQVKFTLALLHYKLELVKQPNGTKEFPARTCKDLLMCYPGLQSGKLNVLFRNSRRHLLAPLLVFCLFDIIPVQGVLENVHFKKSRNYLISLFSLAFVPFPS